jgi:hypothetical protein
VGSRVEGGGRFCGLLFYLHFFLGTSSPHVTFLYPIFPSNRSGHRIPSTILIIALHFFSSLAFIIYFSICFLLYYFPAYLYLIILFSMHEKLTRVWWSLDKSTFESENEL